MSTVVSVNTYTHSVTFVADNFFKSLKNILLLSGLDPSNLVGDRDSIMRAMTAWLDSKHLEKVVLEVYDPRDDSLITAWDVEVGYSWSSGDGTFWTDTDQLRYAIKKAGVLPSNALYQVKLQTSPGEPAVAGWSDCAYRSREGFVPQSLGTTVSHSGLSGSTTYLRRVA
ncbi:HORMA domain containing protein [bacterium]|nr:MAG: HORMA domain containing protein [bacterium]